MASSCLLPTTKKKLPSTLPFLSFKHFVCVTFPFLTSSFFSLSALSKLTIKCSSDCPNPIPFPCLLMPGIETIQIKLWSIFSLYKSHPDSWVFSPWCCIQESAGGCRWKFLPEAAVTFAGTLSQGRGDHPSWELSTVTPELPQSQRWHRLVLAICCSFQLNFSLS